MSKGSPLTDLQRQQVQDAMENARNLFEVSRNANVSRVIDYLLEDKPFLEHYLTAMAATVTKRRQQISCRVLILSIFPYERSSLKLYGEEFVEILTAVVERERLEQQHVFITENHMQISIHSEVWNLYEWHSGVLRLKSIDFTKIICSSLRYEMKFYWRHQYENAGKVNVPLYCCQYMAINTLTEVNPQIKYFSDITEADAKALLMALERKRKDDGSLFSQYYIAKAMNSVKRIIDYLMGEMRSDEIKVPRPYLNPFSKISFHNLREYSTPTSVIPEDVIEEIGQHADELSPTHKLLYEIFSNTGLRLKEVFFLEADCIEPSCYENICQIKFKPHKVLAVRKRHGAGDYHRIMITQDLADQISAYINATASKRNTSGYPYIFLSQKPGYETAVMDSIPFIRSVRHIIEKYDIRGDDGELWHFTSRQFRKTIAVTLIENGATTAELAYWLGHMCSDTAAKYYAEVRKMKLAEFNTRFFREKFDLLLSAEQLEEFSEDERKLLYVDFRLEQRRVELGFCLVKAADGSCSNRNSLYNCVNCHNLCTGKKYLPYWMELLEQQRLVVNNLIENYRRNNMDGYESFMEYKQEFQLLQGYENIVNSINGGTSRE